MKKLLLLAICCFFLSCMSAEEKAVAEAAKLIELLETTDCSSIEEPACINIDSVRYAQIKENNSNNAFFMGLKFGMSEAKYISKVREHFTDDKLFQYSRNSYAANLTALSGTSFYAELWSREYTKNKLVKFTLAMWFPDSGVSLGVVTDLFSAKYGDYYIENDNRIWVKGNLEVRARETYVSSDPNLPSLKTTVVDYLDNNYFIPVAQKKKKEDANKLKSTLGKI